MERVVEVKRLDEPDEPWKYWLTRPVSERMAMVDELRREHHGWGDDVWHRIS